MACDESGSEYCQDEVFSRDVFFKAYDDMNADFAQFVERAVVRDDLDLVHATQGGDVSAFEELVERYDQTPANCGTHYAQSRRLARRGPGDLLEGLPTCGRLPGTLAIFDVADSYHREPSAHEVAKAAHNQRGVSR